MTVGAGRPLHRPAFSPYGTAFLTDAIIVQALHRGRQPPAARDGVVKVRASAHSNELHLFHIERAASRSASMLPTDEGLLGEGRRSARTQWSAWRRRWL
jgi:circadian clock protein KaiC